MDRLWLLGLGLELLGPIAEVGSEPGALTADTASVTADSTSRTADGA